MAAIRLVNEVSASTAPAAEFQIYQGQNRIARLGVHAGSSASLPIIDGHNDENVPTAQEWTIYAIVNGITTPTVMITDPNATVTLWENNDGLLSLTVS